MRTQRKGSEVIAGEWSQGDFQEDMTLEASRLNSSSVSRKGKERALYTRGQQTIVCGPQLIKASVLYSSQAKNGSYIFKGL